MPIVDIQRRLVETGRIRIGIKTTSTNRQGETVTYPKKLNRFRLTSRDQTIIDQAAHIYGGTPQPWEGAPAGTGDQYEVITDATAIAVIVPPGEAALSQWMELWTAGGCARRCDGIRELIADEPCVCKARGLEGRDACKPHTRVNVMLRDLPGLGLWRLESQGMNAAAELAGAVELCAQAMTRGRLLPATLRLEERTSLTVGEKPKRFVVPVLDVGMSADQLGLVLGSAAPAAVEQPAPRVLGAAVAALEAGPIDDDVDDTPVFTPVPAAVPEAPVASIADQVAHAHDRRPARRSNAAAKLPPTGLTPAGLVRPCKGESETAGAAAPMSPEVSAAAAHTALVNDEGARTVARWCGEAGITDTTRAAFLTAFSQGRYSSSKQVPVDELAALKETLRDYEAGRIRLGTSDDGVVRLVAFDDGAPLPAAAYWSEQIAQVKGIGPTRLLREARKRCEQMHLPVPSTLAEIPDDPLLRRGLNAWLMAQVLPADPFEGLAAS